MIPARRSAAGVGDPACVAPRRFALTEIDALVGGVDLVRRVVLLSEATPAVPLPPVTAAPVSFASFLVVAARSLVVIITDGLLELSFEALHEICQTKLNFR